MNFGGNDVVNVVSSVVTRVPTGKGFCGRLCVEGIGGIWENAVVNFAVNLKLL